MASGCVGSGEQLDRRRWAVNRMLGWYSGFGKPRICFERSVETDMAPFKLARCTACARAVERCF